MTWHAAAAVFLVAAFLAQGALAAGDEPSTSAAASQSGPAAFGTSETLQEVSVTAHRIELERRVAKFVNQIAATENGAEGLARWGVPPACPLVSGLSNKTGVLILERISDIARSAGVPLGDEHCRPNLYILVTAQPEDLLRGMERRNRVYTFGVDPSSYPPTETPASIVDEFIKTARPVRVWHNITEKDAWNQPLAYCQSQMVLADCAETHIKNPAACDPNRYYRCGSAIAGGSHLVFNSVWTLTRVFVIVDQNRLEGVTTGQLADYIAMASFAKIKPDAHLEEGTTILTLFNGPAGAAPTGMTDWDRTFLKSLYATAQKSKLQRSQIAHQMVHDIVP